MRSHVLCALAILLAATVHSANGDSPGGSHKLAFTAEGVTNAAGYTAGMVSPGEIIVVFGSEIGSPQLTTLELNGDRVTTMLGGTRVLFDGVPSPMVYSSGGQTSAIVPYGVAGATTTQMTIESNGVTSGPVEIPVVNAVPGIFTADASGMGQAAAFNQDGSLNSAANPADINDIVVIYATGEGQTMPAGQDGLLALGSELPKPLLGVQLEINGTAAEILYAGAAPQLVAGVMQVNGRIGAMTRSELSADLQLQVGGFRSQDGATLAVVSRPDPLPPAGATSLFGTTTLGNSDFPAGVRTDQLLPFEIRDAGGSVVFSGMIQDRVLRSTQTGNLFFAPRVRDTTDNGSGAQIVGFSKGGFAGTDIAVEYRTDGSGDVGPSRASRSAGGETLTFDFDTPFGAPQESHFVWIRTDATASMASAAMTIRAKLADGTPVETTIENTQAPM